jgi:hypothetical protein
MAVEGHGASLGRPPGEFSHEQRSHSRTRTLQAKDNQTAKPPLCYFRVNILGVPAATWALWAMWAMSLPALLLRICLPSPPAVARC